MMRRLGVWALVLVPVMSWAEVVQTADSFPAEYDFSEFKFQMPPLPERLKQEQMKQAAQEEAAQEKVPAETPPQAPVHVPTTPAMSVLQALPASATTAEVPYHLRGGVSFAVDELPIIASNTSITGAKNQPLQGGSLVRATATSKQFLRQNTVALLPQQHSTLPLAGIWRGTPYGYAKTLLSQLVENLPQRDTRSQLLLLRVLVPLLASEEAGLPMEGTDAQWRAARAELLLKLGQARLAYKVLQNVDTAALGRNPELAQAWVQTSLMAGETERGCGFVRQQVLNTNAGFWPRALMVCQALQAQAAPLGLSLQTLTEEKRAVDPTLYALLEATLSGTEQVEHVGAVNPLHAVLYAAYPDFLTLPLVDTI